MRKMYYLLTGIACMLILQGCATNIHPPTKANVPPTEKFGTFTNFELKPSTIAPKYSSSGANQKAVRKIDEQLEVKLKEVFPNLNSEKILKGKTLIIRPYVEAIKFVGGGARFWAGAMAGSSAVLLQVRFIDKASGKIIAEPIFYNKSSANAGAWSMGGNDNAMLYRIASEAAKYSSDNK